MITDVDVRTNTPNPASTLPSNMNSIHLTHSTKDSCETSTINVKEPDEKHVVQAHVETNEGTCRSPTMRAEKKTKKQALNTTVSNELQLKVQPICTGNDDDQDDDGSSSATASSSTASSPSASLMKHKAADINTKRGKPDAPKFLLLLYEILHSESDQVICWSEDGLALQILDQNAVTETILPKYFNHTNFHSFQRQLNYFGFRKWTKSKTDICTFSHMYFRRHQPELLSLIKRKKAPRRNTTTDANSEAMAGGCRDLSTVGAGTLSGASSLKRTLLPLRNKRTLSTHPQYNNDDNQLQLEIAPYGQSPTNSIALHTGADGHISTMTNAISPVAAGGAKKKARKGPCVQTASFKAPSLSASSPPPNHDLQQETAMYTESIPTIHTSMKMDNTVNNNGEIYLPTLDQQSQAPVFSNTILPNLDIVRNRLMIRQATTNLSDGNNTSSATTSMGLPFNSMMNAQYGHLTSSSTHVPYLHAPPPSQKLGGISALELERRTPTAAAPPTTTSNASSSIPKTSGNALESAGAMSEDSSPRFTNSFSDPVDILLRIKKSRALSSDATNANVLANNTNVNSNVSANVLSPQSQQDQADNLASLQNFLLSQTLYTNQLEAQLKLSSDENEALRQLLDAKIREVEALQNERKTLQNENSVLMEGKNKLFEINRDLLSKLL